MAYGIEVRSASGALKLNLSYRLARFIFHTQVAAGVSGNQNVTGLVAAKAVGFAVPQSDAFGKLPHAVVVTDGNVAWTSAGGGSAVACDIYVVHYK